MFPVVLWFGNPGDHGERRNDRPGLSIIYKEARNFQSQRWLKIIHHRNRKTQWISVSAARDAAVVSGGEVTTASLSLHARPCRRGRGGPEPASEGESCRPAAGRRATGSFATSIAGRCILAEAPGWRGDRARHRSARNWCRLGPNANAKRPSAVAQNATN